MLACVENPFLLFALRCETKKPNPLYLVQEPGVWQEVGSVNTCKHGSVGIVHRASVLLMSNFYSKLSLSYFSIRSLF